jgi:hypothetical protein
MAATLRRRPPRRERAQVRADPRLAPPRTALLEPLVEQARHRGGRSARGNDRRARRAPARRRALSSRAIQVDPGNRLVAITPPGGATITAESPSTRTTKTLALTLPSAPAPLAVKVAPDAALTGGTARKVGFGVAGLGVAGPGSSRSPGARQPEIQRATGVVRPAALRGSEVCNDHRSKTSSLTHWPPRASSSAPDRRRRRRGDDRLRRAHARPPATAFVQARAAGRSSVRARSEAETRGPLAGEAREVAIGYHHVGQRLVVDRHLVEAARSRAGRAGKGSSRARSRALHRFPHRRGGRWRLGGSDRRPP